MRTFNYLPNLLRHNYNAGFQVTKAVFLTSWLSCTKNKENLYHLLPQVTQIKGRLSGDSETEREVLLAAKNV